MSGCSVRQGRSSVVPANPRQDRRVVGRTKGGRLTAYDRDMAFKIVVEVASGRTLREVCQKGSGFITSTTFRRWAIEHPDLQRAFKEALAMSAGVFEEEAIDEARRLANRSLTPQDVAAYRALSEQLRWSASRRDPSMFGDTAKIQIKVPVQINTILDLGQEGIAKKSSGTENIYEITSQPVIDVPFEEVVPETTYDPHAPRKKVLTPRLPMDAETPLRPRSKRYEKSIEAGGPAVPKSKHTGIHWPGIDTQTWNETQGQPLPASAEGDWEGGLNDGEESEAESEAEFPSRDDNVE